MKKKKINIILVLLFFMSGCTNQKIEEKMTMTFLSCGKADAILIQYEDYVIMIDTGEKSCENHVMQVLQEQNIDTIDYLLLTHPDKDHIGNAKTMIENFNVKKIFGTNYRKNSELEEELFLLLSEKNMDYEIVTDSKLILLEELEFRIDAPQEEYDSSNNSSLISWIKFGEIETFFGADIKKNRMEALLDDAQKVEIVKFPYHGIYSSNLELLLTKLDPKLVVITNDELEERTKKLLEKLNISYTLTVDDVTIITDGKQFERKR